MSTCCCSNNGPGFATPLDAFKKGPRETLLYVPCIATKEGEPDYLVTIDADPQSKTFSQVIHRLKMPYVGDELHHTGWNACSSCYGNSAKARRYLILPGLKSSRFYFVDTNTNPKEPRLHKVIEPETVAQKTGLAYPHTVHCLPNEIVVSAMGTPEGKGEGGFIAFDVDSLDVTGRWETKGNATRFGYDFWYQPRHNVMISTEWGTPSKFTKGFNPQDVADGHYGNQMYVWNYNEKRVVQTLELGSDGLIPLEVRFLHNPEKAEGLVGAALSSNVIHFFKNEQNKFQTETVIRVQPWKVEGWVLPNLPGLITDILISLNDKYAYFSNWLQGDIRQYDITNPKEPKLVGQIFIGGTAREGSSVYIVEEDGSKRQITVPKVKGKTLQGGPQMIQLSLDGKRLYVTNSLFGAWDKQFYPELVKNGSQLIQIDVDTENGGLTLNENFLIDFGDEPDGPVLAHEVRYPGGDCTSDIWL